MNSVTLRGTVKDVTSPGWLLNAGVLVQPDGYRHADVICYVREETNDVVIDTIDIGDYVQCNRKPYTYTQLFGLRVSFDESTIGKVK